MDTFNLDISLELGQDGFGFGRQLSSASSARSCSTAPSCAPITPHSGRSTPQHTASTSFTSVTDYGFTPPPPGSSALNDYFTSEIKTERSDYDTYPATPTRISSTSPYHMEVDHESVLDSNNMQPFDSLMGFTTQGLEHYPFGEHLSSSPFQPTQSPFNGPPPPYSLHNAAGENPALWSYPVDSSLFFLEKSGTPHVAGPVDNTVYHDARPPYFTRSARGQPVSDAQQRPNVPQRVQNDNKLSKKERHSGNMSPNIKTIKATSHRCTWPGCPNVTGYQRQEHLKRHIQTIHLDRCMAECEFCGHKFNRKDNYKSHIKLHCRKERSGSGTARAQYFEGAQAIYDAIMAATKRRMTAKKREAQKL